MPELPEAEVVVRQLRARILGATLKDCLVGRADIVRAGLPTLDWYKGKEIVQIERRGKSVVLTFSSRTETRYLLAELGMTGLLLFGRPAPSYRKHTHLILSLSGGREPELCYWNPRRFGRIYLLNRSGLDAFTTKRFGCDPLTVAWDSFRDLVKARRGRLKALLMHQQVIAGIGNIYANEILYRTRLHPYRLACRLRDRAIRKLYDVMKEVLTDAVQCGGSSVRDFIAPDGTKGHYRKRHLVYNKAGLPCPAGCGKVIKRLAGERSSFYCPSCQRR